MFEVLHSASVIIVVGVEVSFHKAVPRPYDSRGSFLGVAEQHAFVACEEALIAARDNMVTSRHAHILVEPEDDDRANRTAPYGVKTP